MVYKNDQKGGGLDYLGNGDGEETGVVNPIQVQKYLEGIDYPARKEALISFAEEQGADEIVIGILNKLAEKEYESPIEVSRAIGEIE